MLVIIIQISFEISKSFKNSFLSGTFYWTKIPFVKRKWKKQAKSNKGGRTNMEGITSWSTTLLSSILLSK